MKSKIAADRVLKRFSRKIRKEDAFSDLLDQLHAGDDPPGIEETLEPKHRSHPRLDAPVFLLHDVVQVGARADLDRAFENGS